jgi:thioesterase domain-containing protein
MKNETILLSAISILLTSVIGINFYRVIIAQCEILAGKDSRARSIEYHIRKTQLPARLLRIGVHECTESVVALTAPLNLNRNVHGTAFAGSLYSVAVLASFYLARSYLLDRDPSFEKFFTIVAKSGTIKYKRPVTSKWFVARSMLPPNMDQFRKNLLMHGKATVDVDGIIEQEETQLVASEYSIEICAYRK